MTEHEWPLFHYTSATTALDHILLDAQLRLAPPTGLNDPFESGAAYVSFVQDDPDVEPKLRMEHFERASALVRSRCRIACLADSSPEGWNPLDGYGDGWTRARMWAQYADLHAGICLAFDRSRLLEAAQEMASRRGLTLYCDAIQYRPRAGEPEPLIQLSASRVKDDLAALIEEKFPRFAEQFYFRKAWDWSSETEYRLLVHGDVAAFEYVDIRRAVTGIFIGPGLPTARRDDLLARCPHLADHRMFTVYWRNGFPPILPLVGPLAQRIRDWEAPPRPVRHG